MNSIESLKLDFDSQIRELNNMRNRKLFDECIYVGSGDSYVAGLIAEYLTNHKCRCYSPSDLFNSRFIKDKTYCFISVTGKTRANIEIASRARQADVKTAAVTLNEKSDLAQICDTVVLPKITRRNTPTAGFSTFVANIVTCMQISGIVIPQKFDIWYKKAIQLSQNLLDSITVPEETLHLWGTTYFKQLHCTRPCKWQNFLVVLRSHTNLKNFVTRLYLDARNLIIYGYWVGMKIKLEEG